jgi:3'(2'), 5'-bisphosphate nucleotidase
MNHPLLQFVLKASIEAGKVCMKYYNGNYLTSFKQDKSPLTEADLESSKIISTILSETKLQRLSEEEKIEDYSIRQSWEKFWLIDPLDGTKEFISKNGEFTINIALIENNYPELGVVFVPCTGELYYGGKNYGAFKCIIDYKNPNVIDAFQINCLKGFDTIRAVVSRSHPDAETENYLNQLENKGRSVEKVSRGSALKFCMIAEGKAEFFPRFGKCMEWDTAAGHAVLEGAGGHVLHAITKKRLSYNKENLYSPPFIATSDLGLVL